MFKHVSLREREKDGKRFWLLLGPDGQPVQAFTAFAESLKHSPHNTRKSYCRHLAEFLDYLIQATDILPASERLSNLHLAEVVEAYPEYLLFGERAGNSIAQAVAQSKPPGKNKPSSLAPKLAAVRRFLSLSETVRLQELQLAKSNGDAPFVAPEPLLDGLNRHRPATVAERNGLRASSMLAGVMAGGARLVKSVVIPSSNFIANYDESRAFPYDKALDFLDALPTQRDKVLYGFYAASGCRSHEGLQILMDDIDVVERTVRLVNPATRPTCSSYLALMPAERDMLSWKGRATDLTLLIEPFASFFFLALERYLASEHIPHGIHDFLFQFVRDDDRGRPFYLSQSSSRLAVFHATARRVGVDLPKGTGPHSFRHMYGTYMLNYFPRANGEFGMPAPLVQQLMGHSSMKQTLRYARYDKDLLKLESEAAQRAVFQRGAPTSLLQMQFLAVNSQLKKIEAALKADGDCHY